jgi:hypothetical protein
MKKTSGTAKGPAKKKTATKAAKTREIISPRDPASGLPTGKRMHKPFTTTSAVSAKAAATAAPRDAASGLATGKRQH